MQKFYFHEDDATVLGALAGEISVGDSTTETVSDPLTSEGEVTLGAAPVSDGQGEPVTETPMQPTDDVGASEDAAPTDSDATPSEQPDDEERPSVGGHYAPEGTVPALGKGDAVLSVRNLYKGYRKDSYVLENFSLDIAKGQIVGILGPNGCGKTTLLKMVAGLLVPDRGQILIAGEERSELSNINISYLPERTYFTPGMRVSALLDYFADFYSDFDRALAEKMLADLDIPMENKLRTLSKGMKEKVQLVLVMSRKTKLYLLDEPIGGVDPAAREYVLNTILSSYNPDASVIITTHLIADVEQILDSFAFLGYGGEILAYGSSEDAREQTGKSLDELFREVFRCYRRL